MKNVAIIGGGIIGLSSAYYLVKAGHRVTIFDKGDPSNNCSWENAGMIVPSHFTPLAAPGMISKGIRWMFNSRSPFYVKPRLNKNLLKWGYLFYKHATEKQVEQSIPALKELSLLSKTLLREMVIEQKFDISYLERGLMMLYKTIEAEHEETITAKLANKIGIEAHVLSESEVQQMEPDVKVSVKGGVYFPGDAHLTPHLLMKSLISFLQKNEVAMHYNTEVFPISSADNKISFLQTSAGKFDFDEYVIAGGVWSTEIVSNLGINLPMQGGKGYSFTIPEVKNNVRIPSILLERRVAVTPMGNSLRFGGTMEINGTNLSVNMNRVQGIVNSIPEYYPEMKINIPEKEKIWKGLRPCPPDGLPYIGRTKKFHNLILATGHSMLGLSLSAGTGKIVEQLVSTVPTSISLGYYSPERFL